MVHAEIQWTTINVMGPNPFSLKCLKYATDSALKLITRFITHSPMSQRSPNLSSIYGNVLMQMWIITIHIYGNVQSYITIPFKDKANTQNKKRLA